MKKASQKFGSRCSVFYTIMILCSVLFLGLIPPLSAKGTVPDTVSVDFYNETEQIYEENLLLPTARIMLGGNELKTNIPAVMYAPPGAASVTLVPIRPIAEALGADVFWDGLNRRAYLYTENHVIILFSGSPVVLEDGREITMPGMASTLSLRYGGQDYTMVPLRFVSEQFGVEVTWDAPTRTASLEYKSAPAPREDRISLPEIAEPRGVRPLGHVFSVTETSEGFNISTDTVSEYTLTEESNRLILDFPGLISADGLTQVLSSSFPSVKSVTRCQLRSDAGGVFAYKVRIIIEIQDGYTPPSRVLSVASDTAHLSVFVSVAA